VKRWLALLNAKGNPIVGRHLQVGERFLLGNEVKLCVTVDFCLLSPQLPRTEDLIKECEYNVARPKEGDCGQGFATPLDFIGTINGDASSA
jgi:hypothetical protein